MEQTLVSRVGHLLNGLSYGVADKNDKNKTAFVSGRVSARTSRMSYGGREDVSWIGRASRPSPITSPVGATAFAPGTNSCFLG